MHFYEPEYKIIYIKANSRLLWQKITPDISTIEVRPWLIEFIKQELVQARQLSEDGLLGREGCDIADSIFSGILHQYPEVNGNGWLNAKSEPIIDEIFHTLSPIDMDPRNNTSSIWERLIELAEQL